MNLEIKKLKELVTFAKKHGIKILKTGSIEITFDENQKPLQNNSKTKMSRSDKLKLQKIQERARIDEMMLMEPHEYEEQLATDQLKDEVDEDGDQG